MMILIASSLMRCAILSAHLYLVERSGGSITLPGLIQEWQALSISILFFVVLNCFGLGAVRLHEQNVGYQ